MLTRLFMVGLTLVVFSGCSQPADDAVTTFHTANAPAPAAGTMFFYPERIPLSEGGFFNAERGMMFVPINRSRAESDVIGVEVYRFRASAEASPGAPPIFFLHGGPSFAGLERSLEVEGTFEEIWLPLTGVSDVVVVGQRGIGSSKPTTTIETTTSPAPADVPYENDQAVADYQRILAGEKSFWEESGLDLSGFTALEAAEDVNDVRKALGYDKIIIWGGSFGSHWGMSFMRLHPELVERAILRGMEGPDHTYDRGGGDSATILRDRNGSGRWNPTRGSLRWGVDQATVQGVLRRFERLARRRDRHVGRQFQRGGGKPVPSVPQ